MAQCGDKPKRIAFGVAPLGIISIGIVPMGVVVAGVHAMGIWSLTPGSSHQHHSNGAAQQQLLAYPSRQVALQKARELGCEGVHAMGNLWMPCSEHPTQHSTHQH
jgi:hypothetical protein